MLLSGGSDSKKEENDETPKRQGRDRRSWAEPNQSESEIAQRRIASAICAFGGTFIGSRMNKSTTASASASKRKTASIFREKSGGSATPTVLDGPKVSRKRAKYDEALPGRYYENDNRLSWEFEEKPPIGDANDSDDEDDYDANGNKRSKKGGSKSGDGKKGKSDGSHDEDDGSGEENEDGTKKDGKKIKYNWDETLFWNVYYIKGAFLDADKAFDSYMIKAGEAEGPLVGGNLTLMMSMMVESTHRSS